MSLTPTPTTSDATPGTTGPVPATDGAPGLAVAGRFLDGIAARDLGRLAAALDDGVRFRALLPSRVLEAEGTDAVGAAFARWFGGADRFEVLERAAGEIGGRLHLRWRVRLVDPAIGEGPLLVEQQAYADAAPGGRLRDLALLCTGYRPERP